MFRLWDEKGMVKVIEQRFVVQVCIILKIKWFIIVELEESKRIKYRNGDEESGNVVVQEVNDGNEYELLVENVMEMDLQIV